MPLPPPPPWVPWHHCASHHHHHHLFATFTPRCVGGREGMSFTLTPCRNIPLPNRSAQPTVRFFPPPPTSELSSGVVLSKSSGPAWSAPTPPASGPPSPAPQQGTRPWAPGNGPRRDSPSARQPARVPPTCRDSPSARPSRPLSGFESRYPKDVRFPPPSPTTSSPY